MIRPKIKYQTPRKRTGYGFLYNWYAANNDIAPDGWSVPDIDVVNELKNYLGNNSGGKLKSIKHEWDPPNLNATDEYNFNALPAGVRFADGSFSLLNEQTNFWTKTENSGQLGSTFLLKNDTNSLDIPIGGYNKRAGASIRLIKRAEIPSYGCLYNWFAVNDPRGLAPEGWRIPTKNEYEELFNYIENNYDQSIGVGNHLKSCRQTNSPLGGGCNVVTHPLWVSDPNNYGRDTVNLSILGNGIYASSSIGEFGMFHFGRSHLGVFWTKTEIDQHRAWHILFTSDSNSVELRDVLVKGEGLSVRCIRDLQPNEENLNDGDPLEIVFDNDGNFYTTVKINNKAWLQQNLATTKFRNGDDIETNWPVYSNNPRCLIVEPTHQQSDFTDGLTGTVMDIDKNEYNWVSINGVLWTRENLRTTRYNNGSPISKITESNQWSQQTNGAFCAYNNDDYLVYPPKTTIKTIFMRRTGSDYALIYSPVFYNDQNGIFSIRWKLVGPFGGVERTIRVYYGSELNNETTVARELMSNDDLEFTKTIPMDDYHLLQGRCALGDTPPEKIIYILIDLL